LIAIRSVELQAEKSAWETDNEMPASAGDLMVAQYDDFIILLRRSFMLTYHNCSLIIAWVADKRGQGGSVNLGEESELVQKRRGRASVEEGKKSRSESAFCFTISNS
jgi:hypothetical protein